MVLGGEGGPRLIADPPPARNGADRVGGHQADKKKDQHRYRKEYRYKKCEPFQDILNYKIHANLRVYPQKRKL